MAGWVLALLVSLIWLRPASAQLTAEKLTLTGGAPRIDFFDNAAPSQTWQIYPDNIGFDIADSTFGTTPFRIRPNTPQSTLYVQRDSSGQGNVGINGVPDDGAHLHVNGRIFADNVSGPDRSTAIQFFPGDVGGVARYGIGMGPTNTEGFVEYSAGNSNAVYYGHRFRINGLNVLELEGTGNVGIGQPTPTAKLQVVNAKCNGEVWSDSSSRALKQNIQPLSAAEAWQALRGLSAVKFAYKSDPAEECVGFIAEDVPELVARNDRRTLHSMDLVGVLAKVVQDQDTQLADQRKELDQQRQANAQQQELLVAQQAALAALTRRLENLEQKSGEGGGPAR